MYPLFNPQNSSIKQVAIIVPILEKKKGKEYVALRKICQLNYKKLSKY